MLTLGHIIVVGLVALQALAASPDDWRSRSIYQLVTDRFATTNGSSPPCDTLDRLYCGGTWQGIINKLDYIQNMGFDAIWISPLVANVEGITAYGEAFHGYWALNINEVNTHFGTADDLKALSSALHSRNMYLMLDVVVNHMAGTSDPPDYSGFVPFNSQSDFHAECFISDYSNQTDVEQCWLGDTKVPLADVNTEDDDIVNTWNTWIKTTVGNYSADGVRIDTVKHVRKDFWPAFAQSAGVFTIGEVFEGNVSYVAPYTEVLDSVLDYPTYFSLIGAFSATNGSMDTLAETVQQSQAAYKNGEFMTGSFLENQDNPRFQSMTQDQALVKNAMAWPFVQDGIPIYYYGQEQGYTGGADPENREALWLSGFEEDKPLVTYVKTLNAARKAAAAANNNFLTTAVTFPSTSGDESTLAAFKPPMLALFTNGGSSHTPSWSIGSTGYQPNEELVDVLSCDEVKTDSKGGIKVTGSGGMPQVLLPKSAVGKICPNVKVLQSSSVDGRVSIPFSLSVGIALLLVTLALAGVNPFP